jgi:hypothetical protein
MQTWIGVLLLLGLVAVVAKTLVGPLLMSVILAIPLACFFGKLVLLPRLTLAVRLCRLSCALLWLLQCLLPLCFGFSRCALWLFLLAVISSFPAWSELRANRTFHLVLASLALVIYCGLCWNAYRWFPALRQASRWQSFTTNDQLKPVGPVMVARTDLSREAWIERLAGVGRFPRASGIQGDLEGKAPIQLASSPAQVRSVILLTYGYGQVGEYLQNGGRVGSGGGAYQSSCGMVLLDLETHQRRNLGGVDGPSPPSKTTAGFEYGAEPADDDMVAALVRSYSVEDKKN